MAGPIEVDLEESKQCTAINMIKFLFAFCITKGTEVVPKCDEQQLGLAFEKVKAIARSSNTILTSQLSEL